MNITKCKWCGSEKIVIEKMPKGYIHHAKAECLNCNQFWWISRPKNHYTNEKSFVDRIEEFLKTKRYQVWREVKPDDSKLRIDLIFLHPIEGYIALEAKNLKSIRQGAVLAKTIEQIKKYQELTFFNGKKIKRWAIAFPSDDSSYWGHPDVKRHVEEFLLYFLNYYGLDLLFFYEHKNPLFDRIEISRNSKNSIYIKRGKDDEY